MNCISVHSECDIMCYSVSPSYDGPSDSPASCFILRCSRVFWKCFVICSVSSLSSKLGKSSLIFSKSWFSICTVIWGMAVTEGEGELKIKHFGNYSFIWLKIIPIQLLLLANDAPFLQMLCIDIYCLLFEWKFEGLYNIAVEYVLRQCCCNGRLILWCCFEYLQNISQ